MYKVTVLILALMSLPSMSLSEPVFRAPVTGQSVSEVKSIAQIRIAQDLLNQAIVHLRNAEIMKRFPEVDWEKNNQDIKAVQEKLIHFLYPQQNASQFPRVGEASIISGVNSVVE